MSEPEEKPELPRVPPAGPNRVSPITKLLVTAVVVAVVTALIIWLLIGNAARPTATLTHRDVSATSEAISFQTSEAVRQATREELVATRAAIAGESATVLARENRAEATTTASALKVRAQLTAQAPPTETARAYAFATRRAMAEATIEVLAANSTVLAGPMSGQLVRAEREAQACSPPHPTAGNFALEAKFSNPPPPASQPTGEAGWDYGVIFAHPNSELQYRLVIDSTGWWTINLHSEGYDISNRDSDPAIDREAGGTNTLKLYVAGENAQLFINDTFIETLDLTMFEPGGGGEGGYDVALCAGILGGGVAPGAGLSYSEYTLRSVP